MSRHKNHNRQHSSTQASSTSTGFDLNSITDYLKNVDMNQFTSIINTISNQSLNNNISSDNKESTANASGNSTQQKNFDQNKVEIIKALKTLVNIDRAELLQTLITLYGMSKLNKK